METIKINDQGKLKTVEVKPFKSGREFFLHRNVRDGKRWTITHRGTGKAVYHASVEKLPYMRELLAAFEEIASVVPVTIDRRDKLGIPKGNPEFGKLACEVRFRAAVSRNPMGEARIALSNK